MKNRKPVKQKPKIEFRGEIYSLRSSKTVLPDFSQMTDIQQSLWVMRNTTPKGYTTKSNPLAGLGGVIKIN